MQFHETDEVLARVRGGDVAARDELIESIFPELKRLARALMANERPDHTLGATGGGLVNLLWLKLLSPKKPGDKWDEELPAPVAHEDLSKIEDRQHLIRIASRNMRQILVDYARVRSAQKRPQTKNKIDTEQMRSLGSEMLQLQPDSLDIHEALKRLEPVNPEAAEGLELKYFGGLTIEEGAAAMGIPVIRYRRACDFAIDWLRRELEPRRQSGQAGT
jgi:DNA-directed RNA polymerase specialized sigma24 family protein